jgi:hypothetical protein
MKHPGGTEAAPFAEDSVEFWKARGWEPTEKPAERDPTAEPVAPVPRAAETTTEQPPVAAKPKRTSNG